MTEIETRVLSLLKKGPRTCTEVGSELWGTEYRKPQSYARPAGKVLARLVKAGHVKSEFQGHRLVYYMLDN